MLSRKCVELTIINTSIKMLSTLNSITLSFVLVSDAEDRGS